MRSARGSIPRRPLSNRVAFWLHVSVLVVFMSASSVPTPLYPVYQDRWGFSPTVLTLIFATYVLALLAALLVFGTLSNHLGRRPVLLGALGLEMFSMLIFLGAGNEATLIAARLLQGVATGTAMGVLGPYLIELEVPDRPGWATVFIGAGPALGLALGATASSVLLFVTPTAVHLVFALLLGVLLFQTAGTALSPETLQGAPGDRPSLRPCIKIPLVGRTTAMRVLPAAVASWALAGLILSLGPSIVRLISGSESLVLTGLIVAALSGPGCVATLLLGRRRPERVLTLAMGALIVGMATVVGALGIRSLGMLFAALVVSGIGFGAGYLAVLRILIPSANPEERAGLLSAIYVVSYLSNSLPALAAGALADNIGLGPTSGIFCGIVMALAVAVLMGQLFFQLQTRPPRKRVRPESWERPLPRPSCAPSPTVGPDH